MWGGGFFAFYYENNIVCGGVGWGGGGAGWGGVGVGVGRGGVG